MAVNIKIGSEQSPEQPNIKLLFLDLTSQTQTVQFLACCGAVFVFFLLYGYMQELIFTIEGFQPYGWYLTLVQFACYTLFGLTEKTINHMEPRKIPIKIYILLAMLTLGTIGFSNSSLGYLNYPTQVIFKSCKLIPVLIGSILIQGKRYGPLEFTAAFLMCIGLTLFTLADSQVSPNFNVMGVFMISMALLCDAVIGNVQEKSMKTYKDSITHVLLYSYGIGFIYIFAILLGTGNLHNGFMFFAKDPKRIYGYAIIFSLTGYLGTHVVLTLVKSCGAFAAVTVTTFRKAMTMVMSFIFFSKPFTMQYLWSGMLVLFGIYVNLYSKKHPVTFADVGLKIKYLLRYLKIRFVDSRKQRYTTNV